MSKLIIFLLFALIQNLEYKGKQVYSLDKLKRLQSGAYELNVKEGDEFYISVYQEGAKLHSSRMSLSKENKIPDALESKGMDTVGSGPHGMMLLGGSYYYYYKFKALKPSYNEISLKFDGYSTFFKDNYSVFVKINIIPKNKTN